jgi:hypothetical protein
MKLVQAQHEGRLALARLGSGKAVALAGEPGPLAADVRCEAFGIRSSPVRAG